MEKHVVWHRPIITRDLREKLNKHKSIAVWFTGLPCSGKSTIAHNVEKKLYEYGIRTYTLDGDNVRHGICSDLGFTTSERFENLRRVAEIIKLFLDAGIVILAAFVSPMKSQRELVRNIIGSKDLIEIYCKCPIDICKSRDTKGHYRKATLGLISNFTGIDSPYEEPTNPDLILNTDKFTIEESSDLVVSLILNRIKKSI